MAEKPSDDIIDFPDYPPMDETGMVDLWQIEANLAMTPAQRIEKFSRFLEFQEAIRRAGRKRNGDVPQSDSKTA